MAYDDGEGNKISEAYPDCPDFGPILLELRSHPQQDLWDFVLMDGLLFFRNKLCVPRTSLQDFITWESHASRHHIRGFRPTALTYTRRDMNSWHGVHTGDDHARQGPGEGASG